MTHGHSANGETSKPIVICVGVLVVLYGVACGIGWPQQGTELARIAHEKALPFELLVPIATTIAAMKEARQGGLRSFATVQDLLADLNADD